MASEEYDPAFVGVHERMLATLNNTAKAGNITPTKFHSATTSSHNETYSAPPGEGMELGIIFTTQPQCDSITEDVDGQTEFVLFRPQIKKAILDTPGFPQSVPVPPSPKSYSIVKIPSKGLGMVATRDIPFGELIVAERAMLIAVRGGYVDGASAGTKEQMEEASFAALERYLEVAIDRMENNPRTKKNVAALKKLCNSHRHDGSGPITGILRTNCFGVSLPLDNDNAHGVLFNKLSRLNHSCSPNTSRRWNTASLSLQVYAVRDIKKGEELTTWYAAPLDPVSERKSQLLKYGINCRCRACTNPASKHTRMFLSAFQVGFVSTPLIVESARTPARAHEHMLKPALQMLKSVEEEGVEITPAYPKALHGLAMIYLALGDLKQARRYHQRWRVRQRIGPLTESDAILEACKDVLQIIKGVQARLE